MSTVKPRRRWFAFSLRTLLVGTTAFGCWLGIELRAVRERQAELLWADEHGCAVTAYSELKSHWGFDAESRRGRFPAVRRLFGDTPIAAVMLPDDGRAAQSDVDRIAKVFPEAFVSIARPLSCGFEPPTAEADDQ
jgi:hypothetical protein